MEIIIYIIAYIIGVLIYALSIYLAIKILNLKTSFIGALIIAVIVATLGMIPKIGIFLSFIAMWILVAKFMFVDFFPTGLMMAFIASVLNFAISHVVIAALLKVFS